MSPSLISVCLSLSLSYLSLSLSLISLSSLSVSCVSHEQEAVEYLANVGNVTVVFPNAGKRRKTDI